MTATLTPPKLAHKTAFAPAPPVIADDVLGIVTMPVSVTAVVDDVGDQIEAGAYLDTLRARRPKGVASHDWDAPVAKTLDAAELMPGDPRLPDKIQAAGGGALMITAQFQLATQRGRDAFEDIKFYGDEACFSIGYRTVPGFVYTDPKTGVRHLQKVDLWEWSPVLFGANELAQGVADVKSRGGQMTSLTSTDVRRWRSMAKAPRTLSGGELERWRRVRSASKPLMASELRRHGALLKADALDDYAAGFALHVYIPPTDVADDDGEAPCLVCGLSYDTGHHVDDPEYDAPKRARPTRRYGR